MSAKQRIQKKLMLHLKSSEACTHPVYDEELALTLFVLVF